jgi:hypothetical protein
MGNCQAAEDATVVVQHPGGRVERLYWATSAAEVMRANPGHYVALVTLRVAEDSRRPADPQQRGQRGGGTVRLTRVKLLKPRDTLQLGHAYRLIAIAEVAKAVQARKDEKTRREQRQQQQQLGGSKQAGGESASTGDDKALMDEGLDQVPHRILMIHPLQLNSSPALLFIDVSYSVISMLCMSSCSACMMVIRYFASKTCSNPWSFFFFLDNVVHFPCLICGSFHIYSVPHHSSLNYFSYEIALDMLMATIYNILQVKKEDVLALTTCSSEAIV